MNKKSFVFNAFVVATCVANSVSLVQGMNEKYSAEVDKQKKLEKIVEAKDDIKKLIFEKRIHKLSKKDLDILTSQLNQQWSENKETLKVKIWNLQVELMTLPKTEQDTVIEILKKIKLLLDKKLELKPVSKFSYGHIAIAVIDKVLKEIGFTHEHQGEFENGYDENFHDSNEQKLTKKHIDYGWMKCIESINPLVRTYNSEDKKFEFKTSKTNLPKVFEKLKDVVQYVSQKCLDQKQLQIKREKEKLEPEIKEFEDKTMWNLEDWGF